MKKYKVTIPRLHTYVVEAEDDVHAMDKVRDGTDLLSHTVQPGTIEVVEIVPSTPLFEAEHIKTDGTRAKVYPDKVGGTFSAKYLNTLVGGYLEVVNLPRIQKRLVLHEEGHIEQLPVNAEATRIYCEYFGVPVNGDYELVGDAVLIGWDQIK